MDESRFDRWTRAVAQAPSRRSLLGSSLGLAVAALTRTQAPVLAAGADPQEPWYSSWCTVVDGETHGWAQFEQEGDAIDGAYGNEVGCGTIRTCVYFAEERRLRCKWRQDTDGTSGSFSIKLNRRLTEFHGTYKKKDGGTGTYEGAYQEERDFRAQQCCEDCCASRAA